MTNTISQLWNGNLKPIKYVGINNAEAITLEKLIENNRMHLKKILNGKQYKIFQRYIDCMEEYLIIISEQSFCNGYCLGTKITTEALYSDVPEVHP